MVDEGIAEQLSEVIAQLIAGGASLEGAIRNLRASAVPDDVLQAARVLYEQRVGLIKELKDPSVLVSDEARKGFWYAGPKSDDTFWPELVRNLSDSLPFEALRSVDRSSNRVVGYMRPPGAPEIRTRGLVLGHVQSGKTTSFMSVAAKAADVGYRLIIVMSGVTDNLRSQTQERLDEALVGDLQKKWFLLTDSDTDFQRSDNAPNLLANPQHRLLAVIKKNPYRLARLLKWLETGGIAVLNSCPILLIDDEADQASIDVGTAGRSSRINGLIGNILEMPKAAYIAYTATPFANLLINPSDATGLYPRDFIVDLPAGEGYYGPERVFGRDLLDHLENDSVAEPDDVVREVPVSEISAVQPPKGIGAVYGWTPTVPASLDTAISWFVLATAARRSRGQTGAHSSMLIHTSMLSEAHSRLKAVVEAQLAGMRPSDSVFRDRLKAIWDSESNRVEHQEDEPAVSWEDVWRFVPSVLESIRLVIDNYRSTDRLSYKGDQPVTCIAIGGNTLSRGLTLEGLVCSYFVRAASAYDTLLQMGRWFGYRSGYSDLVRIWMTAELETWFFDLATVEAEIRLEIARYEAEDLKPTELAVKIRTHPAMAITSAAKMRAAVQASLDYSERREQTILFNHLDLEWLENNWNSGANLLAAAKESPGVVETRVDGSGRYLLRDVPAADILNFLAVYEFHEGARRLNRELLSRYIANENRSGGLLRWNVVVMSNEEGPYGTRALGPAGSVNLINRSRMSIPGQTHANIKALAGSQDRGADLGGAYVSALGGADDPVSDGLIRAARARDGLDIPTLNLYPISKSSKPREPSRSHRSRPRVELDAVTDVLGVTIFFPKAIGQGSSVVYKSADLSTELVEDAEADFDTLDEADELRASETSTIQSGEVAE